MSEDLLDRWERLIKPLFPDNAWVVSRYSGDDYFMEIDWKTNADHAQPRLRSQKKVIIISGKAIQDYLDKNKEGRDLFEHSLLKLISKRFNISEPGNPGSSPSPAVEKLIISKEMLEAALPPSDGR